MKVIYSPDGTALLVRFIPGQAISHETVLLPDNEEQDWRILYQGSSGILFSPSLSYTKLVPCPITQQEYYLSFMHSFSPSLSHSLTHSLTHPPSHSLTHPLTHPFSHSLTHPLTHSLTHSPTHALILSLISQSLNHPLTHSLTHSVHHPPSCL